MYEKIRILKHDMKHHNDFIMSKIIDIPEINSTQRKYLSDVLSYIGNIGENINSIKSTIYTENKFIDSLLNYKIGLAIDKNIKVEIIVDKNIPDISDVDLCSILGNLLDNAVEACEDENITEKIIVLHMTAKKSCLSICVKNSISASVIEKNPNLTTTKQNKEIHGVGLNSVRSIAEKYSGFFKISEQEKKYFVVEVFLVGA
jgi:sensor histidine kinase regulating citrate/malate metabolism